MAQWLYTQGENSKFVFMMGCVKVTATKVSKVDAITLDLLQTFELPPSLYLGGLLMHANGHVYCIHANVLYAFWNAAVNLPNHLNEGIIQTNGMLVTQDGYLVVKEWSTSVDDLLFYVSAQPLLVSNVLSDFVLHLNIA